MDKHTIYYTVLDALKVAKECPFCTLEADAMHAYFDAILYEGVNDPKLRSELVRSKGYCHRHAHYLTDLQDSLGIAILYQDQLKLFWQLSSKSAGDNWMGSKRNPEPDEGNTNCPACSACPACRNQLETRQRYLAVLTEELTNSEIKTAYKASPGFCAPHLGMLLKTIKDPVIQNFVYEIEERNLMKLWDELQEFIRKHDYRYTDEPYGKERDSWSRAIKKLTGNKIVF